ncbi:hypothetical protein [Ralstonia pseudosolanacearum]|uniref:hypothetical protein n=1 Tax=Ralstonia pseudosolanacearum TaxID=1310165 RepID=UPI001FF957DF|nr:hypothetical protein [Ralstonia pseudosolanacearum]
MATVLGLDRLAVRVGAHARLGNWLALIVACWLSLGAAQAQTSGVDLTVRQSGSSVPQTPSGNVMSVLVPITIGVAAIGAAAVALPATGALAITGDVIAAAGSSAIRKGIINGAALAGIVALIGAPSGISLDSSGKVVAPAVSANAGDAGFNGFGWSWYDGSSVQYSAASPGAACALTAAVHGDSIVSVTQGSIPQQYNCVARSSSNGVEYGIGTGQGSSCISGYVASGSSCVPDPAGAKQEATDVQIQSAIKASPASWPQVYNSASCANANVLVSYTPGQLSNPCFSMIADSSTGFGVSFSTGGSSWTNNGCAVNSTSCPSASVATAPTTDTQTKVNADGSKTTTNTTTSKTTTVTGTNDRTNPVQGQTTTSTSVSTTVTNPDGSTTTTTTTTTDQAPPATAGNPANEQKDATTATFSGPTQALYTQKTKTFADVLRGFVARVQGMAWYGAMAGFFNVTIGTGACPSDWVVPATQWNPALDMTPYVCSSSMMTMYQLGGIVVLMVAAWAAFKIAFL